MATTVFDLVPESSGFGENEIAAETIQTPLGEMLSLATTQGICLLEFKDRKKLDAEVRDILAKTNSHLVSNKNKFTNQLATELACYFEDAFHPFSVSLALIGTKFQKSVWKLLTTIPAGQTRTYAQVAEMISKPQAIRAVGSANARNPIAIVIPCHRLIGANGNLTGYGGGIWRKEWLLNHEKK
jgi:AraC family transcriptional regulator of adaptative response/methylated-DNA-[protein]-cysteine methyltransferase